MAAQRVEDKPTMPAGDKPIKVELRTPTSARVGRFRSCSETREEGDFPDEEALDEDRMASEWQTFVSSASRARSESSPALVQTAPFVGTDGKPVPKPSVEKKSALKPATLPASAPGESPSTPVAPVATEQPTTVSNADANHAVGTDEKAPGSAETASQVAAVHTAAAHEKRKLKWRQKKAKKNASVSTSTQPTHDAALKPAEPAAETEQPQKKNKKKQYWNKKNNNKKKDKSSQAVVTDDQPAATELAGGEEKTRSQAEMGFAEQSASRATALRALVAPNGGGPSRAAIAGELSSLSKPRIHSTVGKFSQGPKEHMTTASPSIAEGSREPAHRAVVEMADQTGRRKAGDMKSEEMRYSAVHHAAPKPVGKDLLAGDHPVAETKSSKAHKSIKAEDKDAKTVIRAVSPWTAIRKTATMGRGLFATANIPKGARIVVEKPIITVSFPPPDELRELRTGVFSFCDQIQKLSREDKAKIGRLNGGDVGPDADDGVADLIKEFVAEWFRTNMVVKVEVDEEEDKEKKKKTKKREKKVEKQNQAAEKVDLDLGSIDEKTGEHDDVGDGRREAAKKLKGKKMPKPSKATTSVATTTTPITTTTTTATTTAAAEAAATTKKKKKVVVRCALNAKQLKFVVRDVVRCWHIFMANAFPIAFPIAFPAVFIPAADNGDGNDDTASHLVMALFAERHAYINHACPPLHKALATYNRDKDELVVEALVDIAAGDEISLCYVRYLTADTPWERRRRALRARRGFECVCGVCAASATAGGDAEVAN